MMHDDLQKVGQDWLRNFEGNTLKTFKGGIPLIPCPYRQSKPYYFKQSDWSKINNIRGFIIVVEPITTSYQ